MINQGTIQITTQNDGKCNKPRACGTSRLILDPDKKGTPDGHCSIPFRPLPPGSDHNQTKCVKTRGLLHYGILSQCFPMHFVFTMISEIFGSFWMVSSHSKPFITTPGVFGNHLKSSPGIISDSTEIMPGIDCK